jgi:hypothetical protein
MASGVSPLDLWSIMHVASGAALAVVGLNTRWSAAALVAFEVLEAGLRLVPTGDGPLFEYESFANIVADVFVGLIGYLGAEALLRRLSWRRLLQRWPRPRP